MSIKELLEKGLSEKDLRQNKVRQNSPMLDLIDNTVMTIKDTNNALKIELEILSNENKNLKEEIRILKSTSSSHKN